jgi:glycosyltransferase involved in cell wall biosynthesis
MKVAYIVSLFPKISETFILREMLALRALGMEIVVVSLKREREPWMQPGSEIFLPATIYPTSVFAAVGSLARLLLRRPLTVARITGQIVASHLGHPAVLLKSLPLVAVAARVSELLAQRGVDRVHAHWATYPALVAWAVGRLERLPYSITAHAHDIFLPNPMLRRKIEESAFTVTISEYNRRHLTELCGERAASKLHVIRCGIPLGEYRARDAEPPGPARIVSVGRLVDFKGFPTLLRAVAALRKRRLDVSCDIVGDGPMEAELRALVSSLGLDGSVRLHGALSQEQVRELLRGATCSVLACERGRDGQMDGIPVFLMEALALGVPAVTTRISGVPELVEDACTGLLVDPGDPESLAAALARLLSDTVLARQLAEAGRRRVERDFDLERNAAALGDLLCGTREAT